MTNHQPAKLPGLDADHTAGVAVAADATGVAEAAGAANPADAVGAAGVERGRQSAVLGDQAARDRITTALSETLFVEAGAGSGKTSAIVERVVNLVASGVPVGKLAAITFTEAAARELRTRVRDALEQRGTAERNQLLATAAGQVETAAFTTIHGFAFRLLAAHPVEAGLPPGFTVADEIASVMAFDRAWSQFLNAVGDNLELLTLLARAQAVGVRLSNLVGIARQFDENWDLLHLDAGQAEPLGPLDLEPLMAEIAAIGDLRKHCIAPDQDKLAGVIAALVDEAARVGDDELEQLDWLCGLKIKGTTWGTKSNWSKPGSPVDVAQARAALVAVRGAVEDLRRRVTAEVLGQFRYLLVEFVLGRVAERQRAGELAFHDLLVLARRLLRTQPQVQRQLHQTYTRILLDEFQDTDPIQIELAVLLTTQPPDPAGQAAKGENSQPPDLADTGTDADTSTETVNTQPWPKLAAGIPDGRLVVVGDPKQSIYRFRRADIEVYSQAEAALVNEAVELATNFRSVPGIVRWVNAFFGAVMGQGDRRIDHGGERPTQPGYRPLLPHRAPDPKHPIPVVVVGGEHPKSVKVGEIRERESADIASLICQAMAEEWKVQRNGRWLPLRLSDIAVLIPSRLSLPALESAFEEANLPFRPETSSLVYATQEVRDVLAAVRAVVEPENTIAVVAALRSNLFAVSDEDLLRWYDGGGRWDYRDLPASPARSGGSEPSPVADAFRVLQRWHQQRWWIQAPDLVDEIIRTRRLREVALAERRPRDRWRRYRFLAEQARQFAATTNGDLLDFVAWADIQASDLARVTEPVPAEPDDDAVRVLTVHGSKGLEFPMVILAGAPTVEVDRGRGPKAIFGDGIPEIAVSKDKTTDHFSMHASVEEVLDQHERVRLHYVAATRARDILVASAHHKAGSKSVGARTWNTLSHCEGLYRVIEPEPGGRFEVEPTTQLRLADGDWDHTRAKWEAEQATITSAAAARRVWSATALAEALAPEPVSPAVETSAGGVLADGNQRSGEPDDSRESRRRRATALGNAVHSTLEVAEFGSGTDPESGLGNDHDRRLAQHAALHAAAEGIPDQADRVVALAHAALESESVRLATTHRHWRELYVSAPIEGSQVEGFIDLCIDGPDGFIVVDYKTDAVTSSDQIDAKVDYYRIQAAAYGLLVAHLTGQAVAECRFVFVGEHGVTERVVADIGRAQQEIRRFLAATQPDHAERR